MKSETEIPKVLHNVDIIEYVSDSVMIKTIIKKTKDLSALFRLREFIYSVSKSFCYESMYTFIYSCYLSFSCLLFYRKHTGLYINIHGQAC